MIKKIAHIRNPWGCVDSVEVSKCSIFNSEIEIHSTDGDVYITHLSNVLIVKSEVKEPCEKKA